MTRLLIVKTGDAYPEVVRDHGDYEAMFLDALPPALARAVTVFDARREPLPDLAGFDGLMITGSSAMVSEAEPWSEALKPWLVEALERDVAMLGVCYGHQLMAAAFGGESGYHPAGRETGTHAISLTDAGRNDPLLGTLPPRFPAHLTHAQSVLALPDGASVLARNDHDAYQALRFGPRQWSVQFHPEFTEGVMRAFLARKRDNLRAQGQDPDALARDVTATPDATALLARFCDRASRERH